MSGDTDSRTRGLNEVFDDESIEGVAGELRRWHLVRRMDVSGKSGTGVVASGVVFHDGSVAYKWRTSPSTMQYAESLDQIAAVDDIHGHGGRTKVVWEDEYR